MLNISKIESLIKENGWSKPYFCSLFNKSRTWVADWKRGKGLPDENTIRSIAEKLNTTFEYLTDKTEQKNKPAAESDELGPRGKVVWGKLKEIEAIDHEAYEFALKQLNVTLKSLEKKDNH